MCQKLESKKTMMENMSIHCRLANEDASMQEEQLSSAVQSLLVAGGVLSEANKKLQESSRLLSEEEGHVCLRNLQTMLRVRQQYMTSQISMLYPVKISVGPAQEQELEAYPAGSLAASYLQAPLSYPIQLGGSHSYIIDNAPSVKLTSSDASSSALSFQNGKHMKFPLFLEAKVDTALCCILAEQGENGRSGTTGSLDRLFCLVYDVGQFFLFEPIASLWPYGVGNVVVIIVHHVLVGPQIHQE
ncbi:unnamed protein product [Lupinus luteus]|uniref:Uncharacterized protein n=1 Tax=Lupinus luteus TaxID=3873 RepID=A0AAV1WG30_LUPLU